MAHVLFPDPRMPKRKKLRSLRGLKNTVVPPRPYHAVTNTGKMTAYHRRPHPHSAQPSPGLSAPPDTLPMAGADPAETP